MLQNLKTIFQSNIKASELLYLIEDIKPAARIIVEEDKKEPIINFLKNSNLNYTISDFKVIKQDTEKAYSDKGSKIPINSKEKGSLFIYISKNKEIAEKAKELEKNNKHKELGILLGYPECCSEFFEKHYEEESKRYNDYTLAALKNSEGPKFPFYTNIAARHFDLTLLNHFPCSFNCEASIELAKKHLEIIKKHNKQTAETIKDVLKAAVLYTETNGIFLLRQTSLQNNRLYYKGTMGTKNNQLYQSLKNTDYIEIINKNRIRLNNLEIKNIGLMLFS